MLHLITGVPGSAKTAFVVTRLDNLEKQNKVNLAKNMEIYAHNKPIFTRFAHDFTYREYEQGSGHELKNVIEPLPDDYFDFLAQEFDDLRPDYYYQRVVQFNEIIDRITNREGEQGFKYFLEVRTIYTNINALKIDYVRALTYDWRECPDGSVVVIDEVQLVEPYNDLKSKDNPIIQDLTIHRHRGFDFYFITQYPSLLHPTVKVLIGVHYHLTRPYGMKTVVYQYGSAKDNPNALVNKQNREAKFFFTPQQRIFKLYKSTTINTHKKRFPKGVLFFVAWVVLGIVLFIWNLSGDGLEKSTVFGDGKPREVSADNTQNNDNVITNAIQESKEMAQEKGDGQGVPLEYLTKDELIEYVKTREKHAKNELEKYKLQVEKDRLEILTQYDELQKRLLEHDKQIKDFYARLELYKRQLPKNYEITKQDPALQVRAVVKRGNKCSAYNTHGDLMTLTFDECDYYLKAVGRVHKGNGTTTNLKADPVPKIMNENPNFGATPAPATPPMPQAEPQPPSS